MGRGAASKESMGMRNKSKVHKVMSEFKHGKLKSGSGDKVTNRKQAIAIAMNESRKR